MQDTKSLSDQVREWIVLGLVVMVIVSLVQWRFASNETIGIIEVVPWFSMIGVGLFKVNRPECRCLDHDADRAVVLALTPVVALPLPWLAGGCANLRGRSQGTWV